MFDTQVTTKAGAGIVPKTASLDPATASEMQKHQYHYVYSPGEVLAVADRQLPVIEVIQGRLVLIEDHPYRERNRSAEYIKGEDKNEFILYTKPAQDGANEIVTAFVNGETTKATIIQALVGKDPKTAASIENILVPELPPTLKKLVSYLMVEARQNLEASGLQGEEFEVADSVRKQMLDAARRVFRMQSAYIDRTERELINSRKPNGRGKSNLDRVDKHYYRMLERKVPLETDLDFVAEQEMKQGNDDSAQSGPLADAIAKLAEVVAQGKTNPGPASVENESLKAELAEVKATHAELSEKFNTLLDMVESGAVKKKTTK
jgi:hypothetical protein